ncbi:hydrogenase maturation nickel metallochaperone HypA [Luteitalea sp. TBR-22]|uniref:hydrogenase maturation nickel metallochaperone HypA n=1 Tax=Luteitalea sp. TBR-22 TaxID=2802971 RepID=UPI001EF53FC0|nr:hydrogenase maturation nickel metallochaperone HypA [Luteitalea sp. TBR-22]
MHELSIAQSLVALAQQHLPADVSRVHAVTVRVGALAGVVGEALHFCYDLATEGTPLAGSSLRIEDVPLVIHCDGCGQDHQLAMPPVFRCPVCDVPCGDVRQGRELDLASIEYDTDEDAPP